VLLRLGMIAWARECNQATASLVPLRPAATSAVFSEASTELVRLMASLILSNGKDQCYG
jgi:hypothetical protein